ncbi:MAG: bifunctional oligoribonuclease/PAP phosphatase NrnA [Planctomycetes bacterium]|nr:bifunctional oligoribonuclease/PAP phosphatase NrnA [Planctomycetota bacterium]
MPTRNHIINQIKHALKQAESILLTSHIKPDPDGLGSCIAIYRWLKPIKKNVQIVCDGGSAPEYSFLPNTDEVGSNPQDLSSKYDIVMTFDCGDFNRLNSIAEVDSVKTSFIINIDHHKSNTFFGDINWVDATYAATTLMVFDLLSDLKVKIDSQTALALYTGLVTDTGHFSFSNADQRCHETAKKLISYGVRPEFVSEHIDRKKKPGQLKLISETIKRYQMNKKGDIAWVIFDPSLFKNCNFIPNDTQEYINLLRSIDGCKLAILFREVKSQQFKVSMRSTKGIDVALLASKWGGGGHARAAGFSISGPRKDVINTVLNTAEKFAAKARNTK